MALEHTRTEDVARQVFVAMNTRNFDLFDALITEDVVFDFPGTGKAEGRRRSQLLLKSILRNYPKLVFSVEEVICSGKRACVVWTNSGHSTKGETYSNRGITLIHFREDRICFLSDYFKDTSFTQ